MQNARHSFIRAFPTAPDAIHAVLQLGQPVTGRADREACRTRGIHSFGQSPSSQKLPQTGSPPSAFARDLLKLIVVPSIPRSLLPSLELPVLLLFVRATIALAADSTGLADSCCPEPNRPHQLAEQTISA